MVGTHHIYCEEDEEFCVTLIVTPTHHVQLGESGEFVYFDDLKPGTYKLSVKAARLPLWEQSVTVSAGQRVIVKSNLGVHQLSKLSK